MIVVGVDPGTYQSAFVVWDGRRVTRKGIVPNAELRVWLQSCRDMVPWVFVFEQVESFGMAVGKEVFDTVLETGRFFQIVEHAAELMPRKVVKRHLCYTTRANNSNIRAAILDRFGGKEAAQGLKKTPGPLYGVRSHEWSALAIALTWYDQHEGERDDDEKENGRPGTRKAAQSQAADRHAAGDRHRRSGVEQPRAGVRGSSRRKNAGGPR